MSLRSNIKNRNNQLNTSSSKQQWVFSKASRFEPSKSYCHSFGYDPKSTLTGQKNSIGSGGRSRYFEGKQDGGDPMRYYLSSSFDLRETKSGSVFGAGRDTVKFNNYLCIGEKTPGPSKYNKSKMETNGLMYSMRMKTSYPSTYFLLSNPEERRKSKEPGPAEYKQNEKFGSAYYLSKSKNLGNTKFGTETRFSSSQISPGPSDYDVKLLEASGKSLISTMRSGSKSARTSEKRELNLVGKMRTPGPGTYELFSDFGSYEVRPKTSYH